MAGIKISDETVELIKQMAADGVTSRKIADFVGVSKSTAAAFAKGILKPKEFNPTVDFNGKKYSQRGEGGWWQSTTRPRTWLHRDVWEFHNGPLGKEWTVNHIDHNRSNNDITNLEKLTWEEHGKETGRWHRRKRAEQNSASGDETTAADVDPTEEISAGCESGLPGRPDVGPTGEAASGVGATSEHGVEGSGEEKPGTSEAL